VDEVLSIGDRIEEGTYEVHSRFKRAVTLTDGSRLVSVVTEEAGAGPVNLVVATLCPESVGRLRVRRSGIELGTRWHDLDECLRYSSGIDLSAEGARRLDANLACFRDLLVDLAPEKSLAFLLDESRLDAFRPGFELELARHITSCVRDIFNCDLMRGVGRLAGAGFGLTPSGDDFICGLLIGMHILDRRDRTAGRADRGVASRDGSAARRGGTLAPIREAIFGIARSGSILTDTSLALARDGLVTEKLKTLIIALGGESESVIRGATVRVLSVGHTSGADLATGLFMTLDHGGRRSARVSGGGNGGALWS
jgi:hypothetical protein